jgi:uncharacterized transporter YbjL
MTTSNTNTIKNNTGDQISRNENNRGISAGAAVGITIASFAGLLIVIATIWYLVKQKRRQRQPDQNTAIVDRQNLAKASAINYYHELQGRDQIHELPNFNPTPSSNLVH